MNIIDTKLEFKQLYKRKDTAYIALHHPAWEVASIEDIHNCHLGKGWSGCGYHYYVRKDGSIYQGRPTDTVGAQVAGKNSISLGVCFEGNYDTVDKEMPVVQFNAGVELLQELKKTYPKATIVPHRFFGGTNCPGQYFPFDALIKAVEKTTHWADKYYNYLNQNGIAVSEKRFDDYATRGDIMALVAKSIGMEV